MLLSVLNLLKVCSPVEEVPEQKLSLSPVPVLEEELPVFVEARERQLRYEQVAQTLH